MLYADHEAMELARENTERLLNEYKKALETGTPAESLAALGRYKEAAGAYRSLIKMNLHIF